jgi:KUP system potassium uptake protein
MTAATKIDGFTRHKTSSIPLPAAVAALGIVYGDIGTSPLYAFKQAANAGGTLSPEMITGIVSLILWSLIMIISIKYAILIMRADNRGEVEGLKVDAPGLAPLVAPISILILVGLFLVQRKGTGFIGNIFGPMMLAWFVVIGILGLVGIFRSPAILAALNPLSALTYIVHAGPAITFAVLGAAFLAVTGGEAMYADMGHFGALPIRLGWFAMVLPCLVLNYFGQGALLLSDPGAVANPFYLLVPKWAHYPMVAFATVATIIASQAIISGAYSLTRQAIQLGFLPRMRVLHTASHEQGQIYMPVVNWLLAIGTLGAVIAFGSSDALGGAYGIAVSMLMAITTVLAGMVALRWGHNLVIILVVNGLFLFMDLVFVASNATKLIEGGWFPLMLACAVAFLMLTWRTGWRLLEQQRSKLRQGEEEFVAWVLQNPPIRLPGAAAIFTAASTGIPLGLTHHLRHNRVLHEKVLLIAAVTTDAPRVEPQRRVRFEPVGAGITRLVFDFGFMETPDVMEGLRLACLAPELHGIDPWTITYYFRRVMVIPGRMTTGMAGWRKALFAAMHLNANLPAAYFGVPAAQVVEVGLEVEI